MSQNHCLAVILARGGSKRLPGKNLKLFDGKPLIAHIIGKAIASDCFSSVMVSTDDKNIRDEAKKHGALVPFLRPAELADDSASSIDALIHAVEFMNSTSNYLNNNTICLLQPTSPLLRTEHITEAVNFFHSGEFTSLSSMTKVKTPPEWMFQIDKKTHKAIPENKSGVCMPASSFPIRYYENGAIYIVKKDYLLNEHSLYDFSNHAAFTMEERFSSDIDTQDDWDYAAYLHNKSLT